MKRRDYSRMYGFTPDMTADQEQMYYERYAIKSKEDLLKTITRIKQHYCCEDMRNSLKQKSEGFYSRLGKLIDTFYNEIEEKLLPEPLPNWWGYTLVIRDTGICLNSSHLFVFYDEYEDEKDEYNTKGRLSSDEDFIIHSTKTVLLTLEEFGNIHGVPGDTVRQWIRRGKIRSAIKAGNDWRIPELVELPERGYSPGMYEWNFPIYDTPIEISNLNEYDTAYIGPGDNKGKWIIILEKRYGMDKESTEIEVTTKEKEKFELFLISNPEVACMRNYIGEFREKDVDGC